MICQFYEDDAPGDLRVFKDHAMLADIPCDAFGNADAALHKLRLYRRGKWVKTDWGFEAQVRFK